MTLNCFEKRGFVAESPWLGRAQPGGEAAHVTEAARPRRERGSPGRRHPAHRELGGDHLGALIRCLGLEARPLRGSVGVRTL